MSTIKGTNGVFKNRKILPASEGVMEDVTSREAIAFKKLLELLISSGNVCVGNGNKVARILAAVL